MAEENDAAFFEKKGTTGWIYFSRPERLNALSPESMRAIWAQLSRAEADPEIRVLVFTGQGEAFCAGIDMAEMEHAHPLVARHRSRELQMLMGRIAEYSLPTIAAVNGVAMGAGLEICLACDLVVASAAARFAFPETRLGMIPCGGGTQRLARLIGLRRARDMVFTGRILAAEQAVEWGLVNEAVTPEDLVVTVERTAERLAMGGRTALYQAKRCLNHSFDVDLSHGVEYETECFATCFASGEPAAALRRYAEPDAEPAGGLRAGPDKETAGAALDEGETREGAVGKAPEPEKEGNDIFG
jgi:enoyl-CoA hydratase